VEAYPSFDATGGDDHWLNGLTWPLWPVLFELGSACYSAVINRVA